MYAIVHKSLYWNRTVARINWILPFPLAVRRLADIDPASNRQGSKARLHAAPDSHRR